MLALSGFLTIAVMLFLVLTKRVSVIVALIGVPIIFGLLAGLGSSLGDFMIAGIKSVAPTGVMLTFAILYFGIMKDVGMFDPVIKNIVRFGGADPRKICIGTALIAILAHLDGSGASTFLVCVPALLPIYDKMKMDRRVLCCIAALGAGVMNILPWGGPTIRAATSLEANMSDLFNPVLPAFIAGLFMVLVISFWLGIKEKKRLGIGGTVESIGLDDFKEQGDGDLKRPRLVIVNMMITVLAIVALVTGFLPLPVVFMVALIVALIVNFRDIKTQQERITAHAREAMFMVAIIFAAGVFTGILKNSGMIGELAMVFVNFTPEALRSHLPVVVGVTSMPASLLFDPDSYYFGVLPVLAAASDVVGVPSIEVARAAILGQMTTGFPVSPLTGSTFLLIGLANVDLGDHQKKTIPYAFAVTMVMVAVAVLTGAIRF